LPSATPIDTLYANGKLPELALFDSTTPNDPTLPPQLIAAMAVPGSALNPGIPNNPQTALFAAGFGSPFLITNDYRVSYVLDAASNPDGALPTPMAGVPLAATAPTQGLRKALNLNDMRTGPWAPAEPTLLCGGDQDPTVFFSVNTQTMQAFWSTSPAAPLIAVVDVSGTPTAPFAAIQAGFQGSQASLLAFYESTAGGGLSPAAAQQQLVAGYHTNVAPFCALAARSFFSQF
jgi:hypothetical protein